MKFPKIGLTVAALAAAFIAVSAPATVNAADGEKVFRKCMASSLD